MRPPVETVTINGDLVGPEQGKKVTNFSIENVIRT